MKVAREQLLARLQSVRAGLSSKKDQIDQGDCFIFKDNKVYTFNEEINCRTESGLDNLTGAVPSAKLIALLEKLTDNEIELTSDNKEIVIVGKRKEAAISMEADVEKMVAFVDSIEEPKKWKKLPAEEFAEAVQVVGACASKNDARFAITCVHMHPEYLEACDNYQVIRYNLNLGIKSSILITQKSLKHTITLGMTEFGESESWIHFRNPTGLTLSCRRYLLEFPELTKMLDVTGTPLSLPSGLAEAVQRSAIFAMGDDSNKVLVELDAGRMWISGRDATGRYKEKKSIEYDGDSLSFLINPDLLVELTKRHNNCQITPNRLRVDGNNYHYVACLKKVDRVEKSKPKEDKLEDKPIVKKKKEAV